MTLPILGNEPARRLFLDRHALIEPPSGPAKGADLLALIRRLGFVQVDSVNTVERAHHMILWSRRQSYRPENLARLLERDRALFEHWTHDASVIPTEFFRWWKLRFARDAERIKERWTGWQGAGFQMIILLAGLQDIPQELYEAASIDGATKRQQFFYVTLPQLRNTLIFVITITMILAFRLFDQVWALTRGGPLNSTDTVMVQLVDTGFERKQIAVASAIAVIFFVVVLSLTLIQRIFLKEERS